MLPNLIIIGAMKAGTTSLFNYLNQHPDIAGSQIKETNFFRSETEFSKGLESYKNLFDSSYKYAFEASPDYSKKHLYPGVPNRIHSALPHVKLVYVLRDPVKRVLSHYIHNIAHGREKNNFLNAISENNFNNNYINSSKYYYQIEPYLQFFNEEQFLLIDSDELKNQPSLVVNKILKYLGINEPFNSEIFEKKFHDSSKKKKWTPIERKFDKIITNKSIRSILKKISSPMRKQIENPTLSNEEIKILSGVFKDDVEQLKIFSKLKFLNWSL